MKLKTKLTLSSVVLIVVAIVVCCVLIVSFAWDSAFTNAVNTAVSDMESFRISFSTSYDQNITDEETVQRSYVIHIFRSIPGANEYTLYHDQEDVRHHKWGHGYPVHCSGRSNGPSAEA